MLVVYSKGQGYIERISMSSTHDVTHNEACPDKNHVILSCFNSPNSEEIFADFYRYRVDTEDTQLKIIKVSKIFARMECNKTKIDKDIYQMPSGDTAICKIQFIDEAEELAYPICEVELKTTRGKLSEKTWNLTGNTSVISNIMLQSPDESIAIELRLISPSKYCKHEIYNIRQKLLTIKLI